MIRNEKPSKMSRSVIGLALRGDVVSAEFSQVSLEELSMLRRVVLAVVVMVCLFGQFGLFSHTPALAAEDPKIGATVLGYWQETQAYYLGTVAEKKGTDFVVVFDDGDIATLPADKIRENNLKVGSKVTARWEDGNAYGGTISKVVGRAFYIKYDDGDERWVPFSWIEVK